MKQHKSTALFLILSIVLLWFLMDAQQFRQAAAQALQLCAQSVIPALFPFLVVSRLLIALGFGEWLSPFLAGWMEGLFRLPGPAGSALVLGLLGGYPVGAQTAVDLYRKHLLTQQETERLLSFCNNANPVFFISVLGSGVFGSTRTGLWLWLIHLFSALLVGIGVRGNERYIRSQVLTRKKTCQNRSLPTAFVESVRGAASGMLNICAFVTLFYTLAAPLAALGGTLAVGLVELFSLTPLLTADVPGFVLASFCAGWGGLSVLCQTMAALEGTGLSVRSCLLGKLAQGVLSGLLAIVLSGYVFS